MRRTLFCLLLGLAPSVVGAAEGSLAVTVRHDQIPLADAVVSLTPLDAVPGPAAFAEAVIAQEDREYDPYVTAVMAGTRVSFPNRDSVQHHIYSLSKPKRFEKPLYASGASESVLFDQPGVVTLGCNIHDWMIAYVVVLSTPHFAKTGASGESVLTALPPGRYRLEVWHPRLAKPVTRELSLAAGPNPAEEFILQLKPDRRIRRAPGGKAGGY
jgi:plastocyanin